MRHFLRLISSKRSPTFEMMIYLDKKIRNTFYTATVPDLPFFKIKLDFIIF